MFELLTQLWTALEPAHDFVLALLLASSSAFILWLFRARVRLIWGSTSSNFHKFTLRENGGQVAVWTEKFYVQNIGRSSAHDIEVVFSERPSSYSLFPPRTHEAEDIASGGFSILIPSLAPGELLILDMIDIDLKNPQILAVHCKDVVTRPVQFRPQRDFGFAMTLLAALLMLSGAVGIFYLLLNWIMV